MLISVIKIILSVVLVCTLAGCEKGSDLAGDALKQYGLETDNYPMIKSGISEVTGLVNPPYSVREEMVKLAPAIITLSKNCQLVATVSRYQNQSLLLKPKRLICQDTEFVLNDEISDGYIDMKNLNNRVKFQLYSEALVKKVI
jgi:hypothetical protein